MLGSVLAVATFFVPLPQIMKLVNNRNSYGMQPITLCFVIAYAILGSTAMIAVKWNQLGASYGFGELLKEELDLIQSIVSCLAWLSIILLVVALPPHNTLRHRGLVAATLATAGTMSAVIIAISAVEPCGPTVLALAKVYGYISGMCTIVAFLPQLITTWQCKSAGSLSLIFTFIQVGGCYMIAVNQIFVASDPAAIWGPTATSGTMQLAILVLASYYGWQRRRAAVSQADGGSASGTDSLLANPAAGAASAALPPAPYVGRGASYSPASVGITCLTRVRCGAS